MLESLESRSKDIRTVFCSLSFAKISEAEIRGGKLNILCVISRERKLQNKHFKALHSREFYVQTHYKAHHNIFSTDLKSCLSIVSTKVKL